MVQSKFSQHAYEEDYQLERSEVKILHLESPQIVCLEYPIRVGSVVMSPIWNPLICKEVNNAYGMVIFNMQLYNKAVVCVMATNHRTVGQQLFLPPPQHKDFSIRGDTENRLTHTSIQTKKR
jgi:hypothetical protein